MLLAVFALSSYYHSSQKENNTLVSQYREAQRWPSLNQRVLSSSELVQRSVIGSLDNPRLKYSDEKPSREKSTDEDHEQISSNVQDIRNLHNFTTKESDIAMDQDSQELDSPIEGGTFTNNDDVTYGEDRIEYDAKENVYGDYSLDDKINEERTHYPSTELHPQVAAKFDPPIYDSHHTKTFTPQGACNTSSISSWRRGVVTELQPRIRADCKLLRSDNRREIQRVKTEIESWRSSQSEKEWRESLSDCKTVVKDFSNNFYNSPTEVDFPIAYIMVVYTNPRQMVRLIKTLWRPQNLFCIHPDAKQSEEFIGVFRQLAKCLDNVFLPRKLEKVYYQHHTIMDSQMNCYEDLMTYPATRWKYVINICGRELPLKTNREIVESLTKLKGHSAVETLQRVNTDSKSYLARDRFQWKAEESYNTGKLYYTRDRLEKPPMPIYMSTNFIAATRQFVQFFLTDKRAIEFRNYLRDVKIPEEEFYASLIHLPGVPGGLPPHKVGIPTIDRYIWTNKKKKTRNKQESCEGRIVHFICILGVGDLDQIFHWGVNRRTPVFFFNKYFMEEDHVVMDCMEERLIQQNMNEHAKDCASHNQ